MEIAWIVAMLLAFWSGWLAAHPPAVKKAVEKVQHAFSKDEPAEIVTPEMEREFEINARAEYNRRHPR